MNLFFGRQIFLNFYFSSSEHKRFKDFVKLANHLYVFLLDFLLIFKFLFAGVIEPIIK